MSAFLKHFDEKYGGVEHYVRQYIGLSDKDIETIRNNLLVDAGSQTSND
jgi:hypothetical protein